MSKGSNRRPTDEQAYSEGHDRIFGNKQPNQNHGQPEKEPEKVNENASLKSA